MRDDDAAESQDRRKTTFSPFEALALTLAANPEGWGDEPTAPAPVTAPASAGGGEGEGSGFGGSTPFATGGVTRPSSVLPAAPHTGISPPPPPPPPPPHFKLALPMLAVDRCPPPCAAWPFVSGSCCAGARAGLMPDPKRLLSVGDILPRAETPYAAVADKEVIVEVTAVVQGPDRELPALEPSSSPPAADIAAAAAVVAMVGARAVDILDGDGGK